MFTDTLFTIHKNVKSYKFDSVNYNSWIIETVETQETTEKPTVLYFIIDTHAHCAFSHWIFESAIFLPMFIDLRKKHPEMKLMLKEYRKYKELFCSYFGIKQNEIVYNYEQKIDNFLNPEENYIQNQNNVCYFPKPISALNNKEISPEYIQLVNEFRLFFVDVQQRSKTIHTLLLPRQSNENQKANDRICDTQELEKSNKVITLNTDKVNLLAEQVYIVKSSQNIIVTDGSPYLWNGFISENSNIVVLGDCTVWQCREFKKLEYIERVIMIMNNNKVTKLPYNFCKSDSCFAKSWFGLGVLLKVGLV